MIAHHWQPIQPPDPTSEQYDFEEITSLQHQWCNIRELRGDDAFQPYMDRLKRSWAIETGIIEGLYTLDEGVTVTLIRQGIVADYIERTATDKEPQDVAAVLNDHLEAIDFVYHYIRESNPLTVSFIRQLHQVITRHQDTYAAVNQFGTHFDARLDKGGFKKLPNNPTRRDGGIHQYCPPEQVDSEIDNLLYFYNEMQQASYHPILTGAWLHHAFTQIHPFQDGNGRVVRALLTWHLVKKNYLPIVVPRNNRAQYIDKLELADGGDLNPFVDLIVQLEKRTILQALGEPEPAARPAMVDQLEKRTIPQALVEPEPAGRPGVVAQVIDNIVEQLRQRNQERAAQLRSVNTVAGNFQGIAENYLTSIGDSISRRLNEVGMSVRPFLDLGGPGNREHWYQSQIIETANNAKNWVNLNESRFFVKLSLQNDFRDTTTRHPRLVFVISLHHVGRELSGIMEATAFALIEHYTDAATDEVQSAVASRFEDCTFDPSTFTFDPFTFTWNVDAVAATDRFIDWTERCFGQGLSYWQEFLT